MSSNQVISFTRVISSDSSQVHSKIQNILDISEGSPSNIEIYTNGGDKHRLNEVLWKGTCQWQLCFFHQPRVALVVSFPS